MEDTGYNIQTFIIPACAVGAPHRRDRVWIIAANTKSDKNIWQRQRGFYSEPSWTNDEGITANAASIRHERREQSETQRKMEMQSGRFYRTHNPFDQFPTQSPVCCRNDGIPGRLVDITFSKWRKESIKALGNAIVPQIAYEIFKAIEEVKAAADALSSYMSVKC